MSLVETIQDKYKELNVTAGNGLLGNVRAKAFEHYNKLGIPTSRNEEWKYTRLTSLTNKNFEFKKKNKERGNGQKYKLKNN